MKFFSILLFMVVLLGSCQDIKKSPRPDNLIPEAKMVDVLTEAAILHGARSYNRNLLEEKGIMPREYLYEKYGIDSLQFVQSNAYYTQNYKKYHEIYTEVKERLIVLKEEYDSIRELEDRKVDSLRSLEEKDPRDSLDSRRDSLQLKERTDLPENQNQLAEPLSTADSISS